jgi:DNA repair protein RadC
VSANDDAPEMTPMKTTKTTSRDAEPQLYLPISDVSSIRFDRKRLASARDVYEQLADIRLEPREHLVAFDLTVRHTLIAGRVVHIGTLNGVEVHPRDVFRDAIVHSAAAIIIAHNHPSNDPTPSRQDVELTQRLREAGELLGIPLLDHVVVAADGFISFAERNWR